MKKSTYNLKLMRLRNEISFIRSDEAQGGRNRPEEIKKLITQIEELKKQPIED
jgi:hypothetical protein